MATRQSARIFVAGVNHRSGSAFLRDRLFLDETRLPNFFARLAADGVGQALVLSTCDRVEVQGAHEDPESAGAIVRALFAATSGLAETEIADQLYLRVDDEAVRHIFAVAASLDSQVIGEPQVLGQVKDGHRLAREHGMTGPELESVLRAAYAAAKRVRNETAIAERPVSIASAAVQVARDVHGNLDRVGALMIGLGEIADLITHQLRVAGLGRLALTGPSRRTEAEARRLGCNWVGLDALDSALANADIVVTACGTGGYAVTASQVGAALRRRRRRPILLFDGGMPADVDPAVEDLDGAFLYTLDDLERVVMEGRARRESSAAEAWRIIDSEVAAWRRGRAERDAVPTLVALRTHFEDLRDEILSANPKADAREATRLLVNRLLHEPSLALRDIAAAGDAADLKDTITVNRVVRRLFGIEPLVREKEEE